MKATEIENRFISNARRMRAESITSTVMKKLDGFIAPEGREDAYYALLELFHDEGFDIVTDEMRKHAGLEPRGKLGWTERELYVMENARILALCQPIAMVMPLTTTGENVK